MKSISSLLGGLFLAWNLLPECQCQNITLYDWYQWSAIEFLYSSPAKMNADLASGRYRPQDISILGVDYYAGPDKEILFVTTPDFIPGTPFTLSTVTKIMSPSGGAYLKPFPNERTHKVAGNCRSIINVWRIKIDPFSRLWVVDTGKVNTLRKSTYVCPPKILIYDLRNNNKLIRRYVIPSSQISPLAVFADVNFVVADDSDPTNVTALLNDEMGSNLLVYSYSSNTSFVVDHPYFHPDPLNFSFYEVAGTEFSALIGIDGVAVTPKSMGTKNRSMYFHPLSSAYEFRVPLNVLLDPTKAGLFQYRKDYEVLPQRNFHSTVSAILDSGNVMLVTDLENMTIYKWDMSTTYGPENFTPLVTDKRKLQFISTLKVIDEPDDTQTVIVATNRLQNVIVGTPRQGHINNRIMRGKLYL